MEDRERREMSSKEAAMAIVRERNVRGFGVGSVKVEEQDLSSHEYHVAEQLWNISELELK